MKHYDVWADDSEEREHIALQPGSTLRAAQAYFHARLDFRGSKITVLDIESDLTRTFDVVDGVVTISYSP